MLSYFLNLDNPSHNKPNCYIYFTLNLNFLELCLIF